MRYNSILEKLKSDKPALSSILIIIGVVLLAMVLGNIAAAAVMIVVGGIGMDDLSNINGALMASDSGWWALMLGQGMAALITFVAAGTFYWRVVEKKPLSELNFRSLPEAAIFLLVILTQLCFLPFNGWLQEINEGMVFPEALAGLESFFKDMEDSLAEVTTFLTTFDSFIKMLAGLIVIAVVAGVGEELIFRGLIQRKLYKGLNNPHLAIWVAAFIFSAIHMQFYGFLPRLMLGALFGYFYFWTGNIWVPIVAHIFNNGFAVVMFYLSHTGVISTDLEELETFPMPAVIASLVLTGGLIWFFRKKTDESIS
ncbi:CPBP family intramembrane glutamic endopeptidase [Arcticibacterium luteifluviistationis]|uniref:CPBP family intramembrane metalloprotease domain-containing protein n=1 Tax=Arcticibacterium luteifluviistationis TaxID=1784714 RepID=A0A2Z4GD78_9BACT|nr:CPBP family intramembrane glutamic endopeptidase [Arcticibacterium luteifluviistationis]AWV99272.1 CPBP family intramembrane metalloprotease domain-containing protein [Arcticibacterium luteifluviistationis]